MQNYVNNWLREITLEQGATSCPLDLPDGEYRLTLADSQSGATQWEIVDATVADGVATLVRAREGTADQLWSLGSVIYSAITAEQAVYLMEQAQLVPVLQQLINDLTARVEALEQGQAVDGALVDELGNELVDESGYNLVGEQTTQHIYSGTGSPEVTGIGSSAAIGSHYTDLDTGDFYLRVNDPDYGNHWRIMMPVVVAETVDDINYMTKSGPMFVMLPNGEIHVSRVISGAWSWHLLAGAPS